MTEALDFFNRHGFSVIGTGGGCEALHREVGKRYCLITLVEDGTEIPENLDDPLLVGIYQHDLALPHFVSQNESQATDLLGDGDDAVFFSHGVDHREAVKIAKKWLDEGCEHPCGTNGHTAPEGQNWCAVCNTFIW